MANVFQLLLAPVLTVDGIALVDGTVDFYEPGTIGESNRKKVFVDQQATIESANPAPLDANATVAVFGDDYYHMVIKDQFGVVKLDYDYISPFSSGNLIYQHSEYQDAAPGQTLFDLVFPYIPSIDYSGLAIFVDGVRQYAGGTSPDYIENNAAQVTFTTPMTGGENVLFLVNTYESNADYNKFVSDTIISAPEKLVPVPEDHMTLIDSEDADSLKQSTITNIAPAMLLEGIDNATEKATTDPTDYIPIIDTPGGGVLRKVLFGNVGGLINTQIFTVSGQWIKPAGCNAVEVICIAGGGSGGHTTLSVNSSGGGGGGGALAKSHLTAGFGIQQDVAVGVGGIISDGGDSSFGSLVVAKGGEVGDQGNGLINTFWYIDAFGGNGGSADGSIGDLTISGGDGDYGLVGSDWQSGGLGGTSPGIPATQKTAIPYVKTFSSEYNGVAGNNFGEGGGGAVRLNSTAVSTFGGNGKGGIVIVKSYS